MNEASPTTTEVTEHEAASGTIFASTCSIHSPDIKRMSHRSQGLTSSLPLCEGITDIVVDCHL